MISLFNRIILFVVLALSASLIEAQYPGSVATDASLGVATDHAASYVTLNAASGDTVLTIHDGTPFQVNNIVTVVATGEKMLVSALTSTTMTVSRGYDGTTPAAIIAGVTSGAIECRINSTYIAHAFREIKAIENNPGLDFYQSIETGGGSPVTQRNKLNVIFGTNMSGTLVDNSGLGTSDLTLNSSGGGAATLFTIGGTAQTAAPTLNFISGAGIGITGVHNGGTNAEDLTVAVTGSGAGNKTAYAVFGAGGCSGNTAGASMDLPQTAAPAPNCYGSTVRFGALDFTSGTNQNAFVHFVLPADWTAASTVSLELTWFSTIGSSSSTIWSGQVFCPTPSSTVLTGTISGNTAGTVTTTNPVVATEATSTMSSLATSTGCTAANELWIKIQRTDSAAGTVSLLSASAAISRTY